MGHAEKKSMNNSDSVEHGSRIQMHADDRYCPPGKLLHAMHRSMLQSPVMGLCNDIRNLCVHTKKTSTEFYGAESNRDVLKHVLRSCSDMDSGTPSRICPYTWKAAGSRLVTLIKSEIHKTIVWDQASEFAYEASSCASLGPGCPIGTALLGQVGLLLVFYFQGTHVVFLHFAFYLQPRGLSHF